jgi:hypothetical protein
MIVLIATSFLSGCAEFDRMIKPRVEGKYSAVEFNHSALVAGGVDKLIITTGLVSDDINTDALLPLFEAAIRTKRPDLAIDSSGRLYVVRAYGTT